MKLYGKNSVLERLRINPQSVRKLYVEKGASGTSLILKKARAANCAVYSVAASKMIKMARNKNTQGVVADVDDFEYVEYHELLSNALKNKRCPVFLDNITDPQNLGAIIRSLACLGKFALVLPTHDSVSVTETVLRVASGGDNYVPIAKVSNLRTALRKAKEQGFWVMGAVVDGKIKLEDVDWQFPAALVIGSEQKGIRDVIKKKLDCEVSISMPVSTLSFNVGHATTILCYEIKKQRK